MRWRSLHRQRRSFSVLVLLVSCFLLFAGIATWKPTVVTFLFQSCPAGPIISADSRGRLGNNMAEYATIYALGIRYNLTAVATPSLLRHMRDIFTNTSLPVVSDACVSNHIKRRTEEFERLPDLVKRSRSWFIDYYPHRISLFWQYRRRLLSEFAFSSQLVEYAQAKLAKVAAGREGLTFVGMHVRRTDYVKHLRKVFRGQLVGESFYRSAMAFCRKKYIKPVFIITSDDLPWCTEHLAAEDAHVLGDGRTESPGPELDLALMAACNHSVFDYGTYGFFGAFLAGGDMVLADGFSELEHEVVAELRVGNISATFLDPNGAVLPRCLRCS